MKLSEDMIRNAHQDDDYDMDYDDNQGYENSGPPSGGPGPDNRKKIAMIVGGVVLAVIAIVVLKSFVFGASNDKDTKTTDSKVEQVSKTKSDKKSDKTSDSKSTNKSDSKKSTKESDEDAKRKSEAIKKPSETSTKSSASSNKEVEKTTESTDSKSESNNSNENTKAADESQGKVTDASNVVKQRIESGLPNVKTSGAEVQLKQPGTVKSVESDGVITSTISVDNHPVAVVTTSNGSDSVKLMEGYEKYVIEHATQK